MPTAQAFQQRRWLALTAVVPAQFMVVLDVSIVNVALPSIRSDLHFSLENLQWVLTAYAIVFGGALLLGGRLADLLGRRRVFIAALALFSLASLLSGLAWSQGSLITFRALQGLGGALLSPAALALLTTTFTQHRERNIALGVWGAAAGAGGGAGALLGGALISSLGWSWIFYINVPVGLLLIAVTPHVLAESRAQLPHRHFDLAGAAAITGGLMLLVYAMTRATQVGWGAGQTIGLLTTSQQIGGAIGLAAASTVSITFTDHYLHSHPGTSPLSGAALTHGFQIAFYVLAALVVLAAITAAAILESKPSHPVDEVDRASRMAPERLRHGGTAADLAPERST